MRRAESLRRQTKRSSGAKAPRSRKELSATHYLGADAHACLELVEPPNCKANATSRGVSTATKR